MRNLKKILALVLALVMSLSLMAVASADDELNLGDVSDVYAESVDVLTGLKVFMGNKGEFLPKDNITRAEVAAIIYRIVTGDVTNSQNGIYADYNKFSDVTSDAWYAGYVNYCANAEYVKGVGYDANGKAMFKPQQNVTGYEALAMILRAIGYDRNNEFTGPSWQIQTAATARNRGILVNIQEGTLGTAATREAVAEILCKTILVPVADYSLAFGYRTTDANGKDNETLAYKTFKMEKIDGVVMANEYASLTASTPLPAGQTTLGERTLNVTSTLDDIGESRYVYVIPQSGSTRYDLVTSKTYDTGLNNVYDNEGAKVASVGNSTGSANGITSIAGAQHFINFEEIQEYTAAWRLEYVLQVKMSQYDAYTMYYENGNQNNSSLIRLNNQAKPETTADNANTPNTVPSRIHKGDQVINYETVSDQYKDRATKWSQIIDKNDKLPENPNGYTYEYRKVINVGDKLTPVDRANILAIFTSANYNGGYIQGEVYAGTNTTSNSNVTINGNNIVISNTTDLSDRMSYEQFVENYLTGTDNKVQVKSSGLGQHLKIVDNDNNGVAEYVLQTIYTVAIINANGGLDISGLEFSHSGGRDDVNQVVSTTPVVNDGEGELATGNVVIYALIDGNARAQLAATEAVKINTVNRADLTATATGENGKTWTESDVHTHSPNMKSGVTGMVGNTTYTLYFDLYGNLAAYTEGDNGGFVLITDGWYRNAINGGEYAVKAYIDGSLQTVELTAGGSLFVNGANSNNTWGQLKHVNGLNCSTGNYVNDTDNVHTFVANLDGSVITPVDKMYNYLKTVRVLDVQNDEVPTNGLKNARVRDTNYSIGTAYVDGSADGYTNARVSALSTTTYYYVFNSGNNTVVRSFTGYSGVPTINAEYIEDVYVVGTLANAATGYEYYTADVVVVELNNNYATSARRTGEPVFVPDFSELSNNLGIENVRMVRSSTGEEATLPVNTSKSNLDWYDKTNGTENGSRLAGLYYLTEDASNPGTYILDSMSAAQVRGENRVLVGYINRSTAVMLNNYVTVDEMSIDYANNQIVPIERNNSPVGTDSSAKLVESSKGYTLSYGSRSSKIANLKTADAATVLGQNPAFNPNDNDPAQLYNEQMDNGVNNYNPSGAALNEVLIFTNGNITAAISFNEYQSTNPVTRDYAQDVWGRCLPRLTEDQDVKFYGVGDRTDNAAFTTQPDQNGKVKEITVSYATAAAAHANNVNIVDVALTTGQNTNVQSWTLRETTAGVAADALRSLSNTSADKTIEPRTGGATYELTINYYVGGSDKYTLVQNQSNNDNALQAVPGQGYVRVDNNTVYVPNAAGTSLQDLEDALTTTRGKSAFRMTAKSPINGNEIDKANWRGTMVRDANITIELLDEAGNVITTAPCTVDKLCADWRQITVIEKGTTNKATDAVTMTARTAGTPGVAVDDPIHDGDWLKDGTKVNVTITNDGTWRKASFVANGSATGSVFTNGTPQLTGQFTVQTYNVTVECEKYGAADALLNQAKTAVAPLLAGFTLDYTVAPTDAGIGADILAKVQSQLTAAGITGVVPTLTTAVNNASAVSAKGSQATAASWAITLTATAADSSTANDSAATLTNSTVTVTVRHLYDLPTDVTALQAAVDAAILKNPSVAKYATLAAYKARIETDSTYGPMKIAGMESVTITGIYAAGTTTPIEFSGTTGGYAWANGTNFDIAYSYIYNGSTYTGTAQIGIKA